MHPGSLRCSSLAYRTGTRYSSRLATRAPRRPYGHTYSVTNPKLPMLHETVTMQGHLIDSDILRKAFARIVEEGGDFDIQEFRVGKTNDDHSFIRLTVSAAAPEALDRILEQLAYLGATTSAADAAFA